MTTTHTTHTQISPLLFSILKELFLPYALGAQTRHTVRFTRPSQLPPGRVVTAPALLKAQELLATPLFPAQVFSRPAFPNQPLLLQWRRLRPVTLVSSAIHRIS